LNTGSSWLKVFAEEWKKLLIYCSLFEIYSKNSNSNEIIDGETDGTCRMERRNENFGREFGRPDAWMGGKSC
jgi:hypothetical protein